MRRDVVICSCANAPWRFSGMASSPALLANELYRRHPGLAGAAIHPDSRWISTGSVDAWRQVITLSRGSETPRYDRVERVFDPGTGRRPGGGGNLARIQDGCPKKPAQRLGESHYASLYNGHGEVYSAFIRMLGLAWGSRHVVARQFRAALLTKPAVSNAAGPSHPA